LGTMLYLKILEHRLEERLTPPEKEMVQVIVANSNLAIGSVVDPSTMAVRRVPAEYVNSDVITPDQFNTIQGAVLIKPIRSGRMLSQDYIDLKIPKDFSGTIQVGHRAITIQVDEINSISGMIRPGNYIDLFTRLQANSIPALSSSVTGDVVIPVLEDVQVLATDHRSARPNEDEFKNFDPRDQQRVYNTLTLEVTPKEAALIAIAESRGSLVATLRNAKDTGGTMFSKISLADLFSHSGELLEDAVNKQDNRNLGSVHYDKDGRLVTKDGIVIKDPNVRLNKDGLLVTKDGTVLSGRNLIIGEDGTIRTKDGEIVDTASLVAGKNGTLVDKNGNVLDSNGYTTAKGGFLVDKDGNVITHNGEVLSGVTVGKDGQVRTKDGRVITADEITVGKDGKVRLKTDLATAALDEDGNLRTTDGKIVKASDLVTVGPDGTVRTKDGKILHGVVVGKDGELYTADGKKLSAADILMASSGLKEGKDGTVVDKDGKVYTARDLVTIGDDGKVRAKDGTILDGVHVDKDGNLRDADGKLLTAADIIKKSEIAKAFPSEGEVLAGVTGRRDPNFSGTIGRDIPEGVSPYIPYEVEYIIGGSSDGAAKTFKVQVEDKVQLNSRKN